MALLEIEIVARAVEIRRHHADEVAGLLAALESGQVFTGATVAITVTGHGLKDTATALESCGDIVDTVVDADVAAAAAAAGLA